MDLKGKQALITGGAQRVGKAITLMLAEAGVNVAINYNASATAAAETVAEAQALGVQAFAVQADMADRHAVDQMADEVERTFGAVDLIINNASYFGKTPFPTEDEAVYTMWQQVTRIMIDGPFFICNRLVPKMQARGGGVIINIVDLSPWYPWRNFMAHSVGKAGLLTMTRAMALELGPTIRVNAVAPGAVVPPPGYTARQTELSAQRNLLKKWGGAEAVTQAVRYLIDAEFVTGEVLTVDGGERYMHN